MSVKNWSTVAASNASVDGINFAEGQNPSTVNDSNRLSMADVAEWFALIKGGTVAGGTVGGTGDAITLATTPNPYKAAYASGDRFTAKMTAANTATAPTLNVAGLGAKIIKLPGGTACAAIQWAIGDVLLFIYDGTDMILTAGHSIANASLPSTPTLTRNAQTGVSYTVLTGDRAKYLTMSNAGTVAVTLPQANSSTFGGGWFFWIENIGVGTVSVTPTTSTINTGTVLVLRTGEWALVESDNTNYRTLHTGQVTGSASVREVGTRGIPVTTTDATAGFLFPDAGGCWRHSSGSAHTWTIPANGTTAFPIGTAITLVNEPAGGNITLAITTDTLNRGDGTAGTGSRTIAANSVATILKTAATTWMITGKFT